MYNKKFKPTKYLIKKKTTELTNDQIYRICKLKDTVWKYGLKSQFIWFNKYIKKKDLHIMMFIKSNLIGYINLQDRTFYQGKYKNKYFYFNTLVINKKFRKKKYSTTLMEFYKKIILKINKISFLTCKKKHIEYYKKFGWKLMNNKEFTIKDDKFAQYGMIYNEKYKLDLKYFFYFCK